jgi:superkiller protein 3
LAANNEKKLYLQKNNSINRLYRDINKKMRTSIILLTILLFASCVGNKNKKNGNSKEADATEQANTYYNTGLEYNLKEQNEEALKYYDSAIAIQQHPSYYTNRGYTKLELADTIGAMSDLMKAVELDSITTHVAFGNIGYIYMEQGDYEKGLEYNEKAAQITPNSSGVFLRMGYCRYMLGDYENALLDFEKHLNSKYPLQSELCFYRVGNCYEKLGNMPKAKLAWNKARSIIPEAQAKLDSLERIRK